MRATVRKDIDRARELSDNLELYRAQLRYATAVGREQSMGQLSSPKGLLICFGAGCLLSLYLGRHGEALRALSKPLIQSLDSSH